MTRELHEHEPDDGEDDDDQEGGGQEQRAARGFRFSQPRVAVA